MAAPTENDVSD